MNTEVNLNVDNRTIMVMEDLSVGDLFFDNDALYVVIEEKPVSKSFLTLIQAASITYKGIKAFPSTYWVLVPNKVQITVTL